MNATELNEAQKQAVEYTDGPLLIVAGAGTGKTTVITKKIGYLIEKGLAKPEEILALTFTDNAAEEMQERVDEMLNIGYADLQISTFHSFCQRLLERHGLAIGLPNQFKLLTQTDAWMIVRDKIFDLGLDYYRPLGNPGRHIHELLKHFSKCKDELIAPNEYLEYAERIQLDTDETNKDEQSRLAEIANAYHRYNQLLLDQNALDFGDLLCYAVKLLSERPNIGKQLQEQYKYVLVDEFQDVNWAQYSFVRQLSHETSQLTVVGDDDQSIYAFRGASVSNILRFKMDFPDAKEIVLTENYRSDQKILDSAYALIQNNNPDRLESKLGISKKLNAKCQIQNAKVEHLHFVTSDDEVRGVINKIREISDKKSVVWDDFAILVRANAHAEPFMNALEKASIPYEFLASSGLYRQPIVLDCFNFFKAIVHPSDSTAIFRLLRLPFHEMTNADMHVLTEMAKKKSISYYDALTRSAEWRISKEGMAAAEKLLLLIHAGVKRARNEKPTSVLYHFLEDSGYLRFLTREEGEGSPASGRAIHHLTQFFDFLSRYEETAPDAHVKHFVDYFTSILASGDEGKLYQPKDTPDSVNLMTVHGAKGLEFRYVFVVNLVEERFPTRRRSDAIDIPLPLVKEQLPEGDSHYQEERRLMYVATTRAKEGLYLTSAEDYGGARKKKISRFVTELGYGTIAKLSTESKLDTGYWKLGKEDKKEAGDHALSKCEPPNSYSFSQIRSFETCPYQYKLAHVLHIPVKGNASFSFGQSMHATLQKFYQRVRELNSVTQDSLFDSSQFEKIGEVSAPTLDELYSIYEQSWIGDWFENKEQREGMYKKGREILNIFYTSQDGRWTVPVSLEQAFRIKVGEYWITGRIDRVDKLPDGSLEIIDYKTGASKEKLGTDDKDQLLIYQIAAETLPEYRDAGKIGQLTFYYLNDNIRTSFVGDNADLQKIQEKILRTVGGITAGDFAATPSAFVCARCDFRDICEYRQ